jgi:hypothetical protein
MGHRRGLGIERSAKNIHQLNMQEVDFLPAEYRQQHVQRQSQPWQIIVAVAIIGLVVFTASVQYYRRHRLENDLATIAPACQSAKKQQELLAKTQKEGQKAKAQAELYTYLRHPWPRTQLLHALLVPLPDSVTLQRIQIQREATLSHSAAPYGPSGDKKTEEQRQKTLTAAQLDLEKLAGRINPMQTIVILNGIASDVAELHRYIGELDAATIFSQAELDNLSSPANEKDGNREFRAVLTVLPGYGQPGGPNHQPNVDQ